MNKLFYKIRIWIITRFCSRVYFIGHGGRLMRGWILSRNKDGTKTYYTGAGKLLEKWKDE